MQRRRKGRRYPEFRPLPLGLRQARPPEQRDYARFYGNFLNQFGKIKLFSFQLRIDRSKGGKLACFQVRTICGKLLQNQIPVHKQGQVFRSLGELLFRTQWIRVRKVRNYEVGMSYA